MLKRTKRKKAIREQYREELADLPVSINPIDFKTAIRTTGWVV